MDKRARLFVVLVIVCVAVGAISIVTAVGGQGPPAAAADVLVAARDGERPSLVFRNLDRQRPQTYGQVAVSALPPKARRLIPLKCERVTFNESGSGLCLTRGTAFAAGYRARIFGADLKVRGEVTVQGVPSRARVSSDGRFGSTTFFVSGHSYADLGGFSTTTTLIDLRRASKIGELEEFTVMREGQEVRARDRNFWGVTFAPADSDRFFATLATGGKIYLVKGSVSQRRLETVHPGVECPSVSPDGTRIAFKKRAGAGAKRWRLHVLDLATLQETALAEMRSVDDQVEWLDDSRVLYGLEEAIWTAAADGSGRPARFAPRGDSPAVVRW